MLHLTITQDDGTSTVSSFRVFRTGRITDSRDSGSDGAGGSQSVTIDKIADDGVALTVVLIVDNAAAEESKKEIFVPYGPEDTVADLNGTTLVARLERNNKK
ncbi:hypothetical protein Mal4_37540 [Maioricimonas rarisocia]|uniref:Uncharacterized protein n=1 Tax=Maioricimonas rarisocia TaxID=2528026 RepID=A0A517ZAG1_9PLAN|nr:hypothetical protein [Maioricimonas rarisocia]QDU39409.1 hypothetical protein Mal4_37540 [Maioricimonas rarisocia]